MDRNPISIRFVVLITLLLLLTLPAIAQPELQSGRINFAQRNLAGPRLGVSYIPNSDLLDELKAHDMDAVLSQFGWHFEYQIVPDGGGPAFVIELVPMIAGVEYGTLLPHATLAMGIRMPNGIEFGLGPNLMVTEESLHTSLVLAVGKTFNYGGVNIPINLAFATNPDGPRISFIFGYSIDRRASQ